MFFLLDRTALVSSGVRRVYYKILLLSAFSAAGTEMLRLVLPLIAFEIEQSEIDLTVVRGASFIPNILLGIAIGVINDQILKRTAVRIYLWLQVVMLSLFFIAISADLISLPALVVVIIALAGTQYAFGNARIGYMKVTLPNEILIRANSSLSGLDSAIVAIAPGVAGLLLSVMGASGTVAICLIAILVAAIVSQLLDNQEEKPKSTPFVPAVVEGWRAFRSNHILVAMSLTVLVVNATEGIYQAMLIVFVVNTHGGSAWIVGLILSCGGVGAIAGAAAAPAVRNSIGTAWTFILPVAITGLVYSATPFCTSLPAVAISAFLEGAVSTVFVIGLWTFRQETTSAATIGRVAGISGAIFKIGMPPTILLSGYLSEQISISVPFLFAASVNALCFLVLIVTPFRRMRVQPTE